jgi:hypothetical protein
MSLNQINLILYFIIYFFNLFTKLHKMCEIGTSSVDYVATFVGSKSDANIQEDFSFKLHNFHSKMCKNFLGNFLNCS